MDINYENFKSYNMFDADVEIKLAKPTKKVVGNLTEAFDVSQVFKMGQLNEISFSIPYIVEKNFLPTKNKHVDKIRHRHLLSVTSLGKDEWYVIVNVRDDINDTNVKHLTAYSLGFQLSDKYIRQWAGVLIDSEYRKESLNLKQVIDNLLYESSWTVGSMDTIFITRYRSFDFSDITILDAIYNVAEKFNSIITWDTHNKKINFYDAEKYGAFRGLKLSDDQYLSSYEKQSKSDEMATRLRLYGKDGLTINEVSLTGMDYVEDFSYFLNGFSMDDSGNVISSSPDMEDDLCKAIIEYQTFVNSKDGEFNVLLSQKEKLESQKILLENEKTELISELTAIQVTIDLNDTQKIDNTATKLIEANKKSEIADKELSIDNVNESISTIESSMLTLKTELSMGEHFTENQMIELDDYIIYKTWENENISDAKELLELGMKELDKLNKPSSVYNIGLVYLLKIAEAKRLVPKLRLGDKIKVNKKEINEEVESQITEISIDYDNKDINLTITDSTVTSDVDALTKMIYQSNSTSSTVNLNKKIWNDISNVGTVVNDVLNNKWDTAKREIVSGAMQSVVSDNRGITTTDMVNPDKFVRIMGGIIGMTNDGGDTFRTALTADGIVAEEVVGRLIAGQHLYMDNEAGSFRFDQDGATIKNSAFKLISDENGNGVVIDSTGFTSTAKDLFGNDKVITKINATDGIKISSKKGTTWTDEFYYDIVNERLIVDGEINAKDLKINGQSVLTSGGKIDGLYITNLNANTITSGTIKAENINTTGLTVERLESKINGIIVAKLFRDASGGFFEVRNSSGGKAIQLSVFEGNVLPKMSFFKNNTETVALDNGGIKIYREENQLFLGGISKYSNGDMYIQASDANGDSFLDIDKSNFKYKGNNVATQSYVDNSLTNANTLSAWLNIRSLSIGVGSTDQNASKYGALTTDASGNLMWKGKKVLLEE